MRLYKVKTHIEFKIETKWFWKRKINSCWVTTNVKYVYAKNEAEAEQKYIETFYNPINEELCYYELLCLKYSCDNMSDNMNFNLGFNQNIIKTTESILVSNDLVVEKFDTIKNNSTASDFRDWFMNGESKQVNLDKLLEEL